MYIIYFLCFFLVRRLGLRNCNFPKKRICKIKKMFLETRQYFQQLSVYNQYQIFEFCIFKKSPKTEQFFWKFRTTKKIFHQLFFSEKNRMCTVAWTLCAPKKEKKTLLLSFSFPLRKRASLAIVFGCAFFLF